MGDSTTAIVRIEQLYPFPSQILADLLESYRSVRDKVWVQEEPRNRGGWMFMQERFSRELPGVSLSYVGRDEAASPATGSHQVHGREQEEIVQAALGGSRTARGAAPAQTAVRSRNGGAKPPAKEGRNGGSAAKERHYAK